MAAKRFSSFFLIVLLWPLLICSIPEVAGKPINYRALKEMSIERAEQAPKSPEALESWIYLADHATSLHWTKYEDAELAYKRIVEAFPRVSYADDAAYYLAHLYHYYLFDYHKALTSYEVVLRDYGGVRFDRFHEWRLSDKNNEEINLIILRIEELIADIERVSVFEHRGTPQEIFDAMYALASNYRKERNFAEAISLYEKLSQNSKEENSAAELLYQVGMIQLHEVPDSYSRASGKARRSLSDASISAGIKTMRRIAQDYPSSHLSPMALLEAAKGCLRIEVGRVSRGSAEVYNSILGDYPTAESILTGLLDKYQGSDVEDEALFYLGHVLESEKLIPLRGAMVRYGKVVAEEPYDPKKVRVHGLRKFSDAIATYNKLVSKYPDSEYSIKAKDRLDSLAKRTKQNNE